MGGWFGWSEDEVALGLGGMTSPLAMAAFALAPWRLGSITNQESSESGLALHAPARRRPRARMPVGVVENLGQLMKINKQGRVLQSLPSWKLGLWAFQVSCPSSLKFCSMVRTERPLHIFQFLNPAVMIHMVLRHQSNAPTVPGQCLHTYQVLVLQWQQQKVQDHHYGGVC